MRGPANAAGVDPESGPPAPVTDEEADRIYRLYWTTDRSQHQVARDVGRHQSTVCEIVNRAPRFQEATAEAARELGYPEKEQDGERGGAR